jgi:hypothetical protein
LGKLAVCPVFPKGRIEGIKANCQFALPSRRDFHSFRASQRDMKAPQKPRAAGGGAGQTLPKTANGRLFQLIFNWRRRAI